MFSQVIDPDTFGAFETAHEDQVKGMQALPGTT